jgi:site-specific DNA-methyltransferase (adenine-specific)
MMFCGDSKEILRDVSIFGDKCIDHTITDPPYSQEFHSVNRIGGGNDGADRRESYGFDGLKDEDRPLLAEVFHRITKRWVACFSDPESAHLWKAAMLLAGMRYKRQCIWVKLGCTPNMTGDGPASGHEPITFGHAKAAGHTRWNGGGNRGVWIHPIVHDEIEREHSTPKPVALMLDIVKLFTDAGEVVLDPFAGGASTGVACMRLGREFVGIELRPEAYAKACERLRAEENQSTVAEQRSGQAGLFERLAG